MMFLNCEWPAMAPLYASFLANVVNGAPYREIAGKRPEGPSAAWQVESGPPAYRPYCQGRRGRGAQSNAGVRIAACRRCTPIFSCRSEPPVLAERIQRDVASKKSPINLPICLLEILRWLHADC